MIALLFAGLSGISYGASDFAGALASKRNDAVLVTIAMQVVSLVALGVIIVSFVDSEFLWSDMWWGGLGGVGAALGLTTFYKALSTGPMSTAASVTGLVGALIPVTAGLLLGEIPSTIQLWGIGLAIPAAVIVSVGAVGVRSLSANPTPRDRVASKDRAGRTRGLSILAGIGFGLFFVALAQTTGDGLYPLVGARVASIGVLGVALTVAGSASTGIIRPDWFAVAVAGVLDCAANSFYLLALDRDSGTFTWVAPVVSLYPVATVLLARLLLHERITRVQMVGLGLAGGALWLIAQGA